MRLSVNVPATLAAALFAVAFLVSAGALDLNAAALRDAGLFFLALGALAVWNR